MLRTRVGFGAVRGVDEISSLRRWERMVFVPELAMPHLKARDLRSVRRKVVGILRAIHGAKDGDGDVKVRREARREAGG